MPGSIVVESEDGELLAVTRVPVSDVAGAARLRRQATRLEDARHPGVVELVDLRATDGADGTAPALELRTRFVGGTTLATRRGDPTRLPALLAEVAATVAALHERGCTHGALTAEHVVLAPTGAPVLCGLGDGERADGTAATAADDVAALADLLGATAAACSDAGVAAALRTVAASVDPSTTAAEISARLAAAAVADPMRPRRRRTAGRAVAAVLVVTLGTAAGAVALGPTTHDPASPGGSGPAAPTGDGQADVDGDGDLDDVRWSAGVLRAGSARWTLGQRGDALALGDWDCDGVATPALVRAGDRSVFLFPRWAGPGDAVDAVLHSHLPAGAALIPAAACGAPLARSTDGSTTPLDTEERTR